MAKTTTNGFIKVGWILDTDLPDKEFPTASTLNTSALDLSTAISWDEYEIGNASTGDLDDRAITDLGNALSRGAASYSAALSFFRNDNALDSASTYVQAYEAFRVERTTGWLVVRVNKAAGSAWAGGDTISLYKFIADTTADDTEGDGSTKFQVTFLQQGQLYVHTMVAGAGVISGIASTKAASVGDVWQLAPVVAGQSIVSRATYSSADLEGVRVSEGGTATAVSAGVVVLTVQYGAATAPVIQTVTVT